MIVLSLNGSVPVMSFFLAFDLLLLLTSTLAFDYINYNMLNVEENEYAMRVFIFVKCDFMTIVS